MWLMSTASAAKTAIGLVLAILVGCEITPVNGLDGGSGSATDAAANVQPTDLRPIGADKLCQKLIGECALGFTNSTCLSQYLPLRVSATCASVIPMATCADLATTTSAVSQTCFPPCSAGTAPVCNADGTITLCTESNTVNIVDCRDTCTASGFNAWTGSCGTTFDGQIAARPQCWCR